MYHARMYPRLLDRMPADTCRQESTNTGIPLVHNPVIVYSTPLCAPCEALKRHLTARGVSLVTKDLMMDEYAAEFVEGRGIRTSPVLEIRFCTAQICSRATSTRCLSLVRADARG